MLRPLTLLRWLPSGQGKKRLVGWMAQSCQQLTNNKESVKATLHFQSRVAATGEVPMATGLAARWCPLVSQLTMIILAQMQINRQEALEWSARAKRQVWSRQTLTNSIIVCEAVWVHRISSSKLCLEVTKACYQQDINSIEIKLAITVKTLNNHKTKLKSNSLNHWDCRVIWIIWTTIISIQMLNAKIIKVLRRELQPQLSQKRSSHWQLRSVRDAARTYSFVRAMTLTNSLCNLTTNTRLVISSETY